VFLYAVEAKDAELKEALERKESDMAEMRRRMRDQERERQSEILKLQMEVYRLATVLKNYVCNLFLIDRSADIYL
jgi:hypothetical protein